MNKLTLTVALLTLTSSLTFANETTPEQAQNYADMCLGRTQMTYNSQGIDFHYGLESRVDKNDPSISYVFGTGQRRPSFNNSAHPTLSSFPVFVNVTCKNGIPQQ